MYVIVVQMFVTISCIYHNTTICYLLLISVIDNMISVIDNMMSVIDNLIYVIDKINNLHTISLDLLSVIDNMIL